MLGWYPGDTGQLTLRLAGLAHTTFFKDSIYAYKLTGAH